MTVEEERTDTPERELKPAQKSLRNFKEFAAFIVGLASGLAGLASPSKEVSRLVLMIVGAACLLYLVVRSWHHYLVSRTRDLQSRIDDLDAALVAQRDGLNQVIVSQGEGHQRYVDAIQRVIDREAVLFEETLHVTVIVGDTDEQDRVIERRHTTPDPRVVHRSMRPIMPTDNGPPLRFDDISYSVRFLDGDHRADQLAMVEDGHLRVWLVFDTDLSTETDWEVSYHPRGLWRPLRQRGRDKLRWRDQLTTANSRPSALTSFVMTFVFPPGSQKPQVYELGRLGSVKEAEMIESGQWVVEWRDDEPAGRFYEWELNRPLAHHPGGHTG